MCGIVGYVGKEKQTKSLIKILQKLEYRGYDSAGFASLKNSKFEVLKKCGNINNLFESVAKKNVSTCFISHTRWATHGKATKQNAHPHFSKNEQFAVVHNGIIENYEMLKSEYNLTLKSDTDTEVIAQILEKFNAQTIFDFIDTFKIVKGSYAILALSKNKQSTMFLAKQKSPLYVAQNENGDTLVASDPICFVDFAKNYYSFNDDEFAEINGNKITFYNSQKNEIKKPSLMLDDFFETSNKGKFEHFMLKEIYEEKEALLRQVKTYEEQEVLKKFDKNFISNFNEIKFIGCGTAYHAGLMGAKFVEKILNKKSSTEIASEFIYQKPNFISKETLYVFVSQSGETADTLLAHEMVKSKGTTTIALTNVLYSSLAKKSDFVLPILAGVEIAVASTKAYVCMLSSIYLFCKFMQGKKEYKYATQKLKILADKITKFDTSKLDKIAETLTQKNEAVFIGKGMDYITALEGSLKLKEITYINANAYPAGELKHGFLALIEKGTPLFVFMLEKDLTIKTKSSMKEAESRGAKSIVFTNQKAGFETEVEIQESDEIVLQIAAIVPMQYLAYKVSVLKGINPDQPRNLAKSVTVEWFKTPKSLQRSPKSLNVKILKFYSKIYILREMGFKGG